MSEIHEAVSSGNLALVHRILQRDPSCVNHWDAYFFTPLHLVYRGIDRSVRADDRLSIMQILLDYGADVNARAERCDGYTPLYHAIMREQIEGVKLLLKNGADPNILDTRNSTALHFAVVDCDSENIIQLLLEHGADINAVDFEGCTPLDIAMFYCNWDFAEILINAGAKATSIIETLHDDPDDDDELTEQIEFSILRGAEIDGQFSIKALYFSYLNSYYANLLEKVLVKNGVDVDRLKREGEEMTELHIAAKNENYAQGQVQALLWAGADVNAKNCKHETPLHVLLDTENAHDHDRLYRIARLLIDAGADLHSRNCLNLTAFQLAVYHNHSKVVNFMLAQTAGIEKRMLKSDMRSEMWPRRYRQFFTNVYPLAAAIVLGYEGVVHRLIKMEHHIDVTNNINNLPPLYYAIKGRQYEITKMLLEAGCQIDGRYPYHIPGIDFTKNDNTDLELVCLVWEFNCISILRKAIIDAIKQILNNYNVTKVIYLLMFFYNIGLISNKLSKNFFPLSKEFYSNKSLSLIFASSKIQVDELMDDIVCGSLSKFDLLTMKLDSLVKFLNDEDNFKTCEKLRTSINKKTEKEVYEYAIKVRIDLAIERRRLFDCAKDCLMNAICGRLESIKSSLPDEVACNIISYLNIRELKILSLED